MHIDVDVVHNIHLSNITIRDQGTDVVDILAGRIIPLRLGKICVDLHKLVYAEIC